MRLRLVRHLTTSEVLHNLEKRYGSLADLKNRLRKDPENFLYQMDLETWQQHLKHPPRVVEEKETIHLQDLQLWDLKLLQIIKKENPHSIGELSTLVGQDTESQVHRLAKEGLLKLVAGPEGTQKPVVAFNIIEIEI